ncbi:MAG: hypothetical protein ACE5JE_02600 [Thermoplasmata archaeon]
MRRTPTILLVCGLLALVLLLLPPPVDPAPGAQGSHRGDILCPAGPLPTQNGAPAFEEFAENFFDSQTKTVVYFHCMEDAKRTMHVGLISPWQGWTEMRFQSTDEWDGSYNVVRLSMSDGEVEAVDGYLAEATSSFVDDRTLGGTFDVIGVTGGVASEHTVYEFGFPLFSADVYDSQLTRNGSFYFQLAYATEEGPFIESEPHFIQIGQFISPGEPTSLEVSLPPGGVALGTAEVIVTLRDERGQPLPLRPVSAFVQTTFGFLDLGLSTTNAQGVASFEYTPRDEGSYLMGAAFPGEGGYTASVSWVSLAVSLAPEGFSLIPRDLAIIQTLIVLVIGLVWGTYGYSLFVVRQAMKAPLQEEGTQDEATPRQ